MNAIVNAFAFSKEHGNSFQLVEKTDDEKLNLYMKNIVVSLTSAKLKNPADEVMLITNITVPQPYASLLDEAGISVRKVPFDCYLVPKRFSWSLAFYKLCVLRYLAEQTEYEKILLLDTDTITMHSFEHLWKEAEHGLMLYNINHAYNHPYRGQIVACRDKFFPECKDNVVHYGGEFLCATREVLSAWMEECNHVFSTVMADENAVPENIGDEEISALAAVFYRKKAPIYEAGAYIYRYWTFKKFYLISTNTVSNPVCIWHLPGEKDSGILRMYGYYVKNKSYPAPEKAIRYFGIAKAKRPLSWHSLWHEVKKRCRK
ncbi:MAG: hypothetical protein E7285_06530 [Lachnospiraceae bacterium]|nr:hypothetical protein [Lachnospiraceae bacterium]